MKSTIGQDGSDSPGKGGKSLTDIKHYFSPPVFPGDMEKTRSAKILHSILLSTLVFTIIIGGIGVPFIFIQKQIFLIVSLPLAAFLALIFWILRRGWVKFASVLFSAGLWASFTFFIMFSGGMHSVITIFYLVGVVFTQLLLGWRNALIYTAACCLAGLGMVILESSGYLPRIFPVPSLAGWLGMGIAIIVTLVMVRLVFNDLNDTLLLTQKHLEERNQAEAVLKASEEKFHSMIDQATEGFALTDEKGILVEWNHAMEQIAGIPHAQVMQLPFSQALLQMMAPEQRTGEYARFLEEELSKAILTGESRYFDNVIETEVFRPDGTSVIVELRNFPVRIGDKLRVGTMALDITKHKQADRDLSLQFERLRALNNIEHSMATGMNLNVVLDLLVKEIVSQLQVDATSVLLLDSQNEYLIFRAGDGFLTQALRFTHLKMGAGLAGRAASERRIVHIPDLAEITGNPVLAQSIINENFVTYYGIPLIAKGQLYGVLEIFHRSRLDPDPNWLTFLETLATQAAISIDNSRMIETINANLRETSALYRINRDLVALTDPLQLLNNVVELLQEEFGYFYVQIFVTDPETGDFVIRAGSGTIGKQLLEMGYRLQAGDGIVGYTAETGLPFFSNDASQVLSFVSNPLIPDAKSELAVPIKTEDRFLGMIDVIQIPPLILTERDVRLVEAVSNQLAVALQKAQLYTDLQNSLQQVQDAQAHLIHSEKLAVAGRLLASVSHELNNPIQAIQNTLFLLKNESGISEQGKQDLDVVLSETERMASLIDRLRTTYRAARAEDFHPIQINSLIEDIHVLLTTHLRHAKVAFTFRPAPDLPAIPALEDQMKQVILNLFMNSIDAMADGGQLTVSTDWLKESHEILIHVTDTGTGIEESMLPNLFVGFITTKKSGTGLGLAISHEIILKHHGRIQAANNPQGGATFSIWLPVGEGGSL
jgi:PAS domain S-box-containing protein